MSNSVPAETEVEKTLTVENINTNVTNKPNNGLAHHEKRPKTSEERKEERRFLLKIDLIILPLLAVVYFLASLDRGDISNAAVAGMTTDLGLTPQMLSHCVALFYVGYILFMLPAAIFMRKITPPRQLALALMGWGAFTAMISLAKSYATVVGLRVLVGTAEAFVNAAPLYLSLWYKRDELAFRGAVFFSMAAVAGSFNGVISYAIEHNLNGVRGLAAWRWIFLIEGVISALYGFVVLFSLPPVPERVKWGFTAREKEIAKQRTAKAYNVENAAVNWKHLIVLAKDPKVYFSVVIYCCINVSLAAFSSFLPVVIKSFGCSTLQTQTLTIPVFICAGVALLIFGFLSDYCKKRGIFLVTVFAIAALGYLLLLVSHSSRRLSFAATFLIGIGTFPCVVITQAWINGNLIGYTKRAGCLAALNMFGQCFSIIGVEVYSDPPHYYRGNGFALGAMVVGIITTLLFQLYLHRRNLQKARNQHTEAAQRMRVLGVAEVGDDHPDFFYYL
ncbi:hypothetical protein VTN77DRAFT_9313 [Rasamsonia byssochlamydoides]|uniref:uncharacterized protein n=1 Tax=Rasamsonia byssochlamydoides TaxID=89139 RepID=UPI003744A3C3